MVMSTLLAVSLLGLTPVSAAPTPVTPAEVRAYISAHTGGSGAALPAPDLTRLAREYVIGHSAGAFHATIPSYSRQTGYACSECHTAFPLLNSFGRRFKLNGYTLTDVKTIQGDTTNGETLRLPLIPPISAMVETSFSQLKTAIPGTKNGEVQFPQSLGLYVGGAISPRLGTFIQLNYDGSAGTLGLDMAEIRYARHTTVGNKELLLGALANNNPGLQDVWNSVPAWRFPFMSSAVAPSPAAAPLAEGALMQQVAGFGVYALWNKLLYVEYAAYRSAVPGGPHPPDSSSTNTIQGVASYWRSYLQHSWGDQTLMVGTFGMSGNLFPTGIVGAVNRYRDVAFDAQYDRPLGSGTLSAHGSWLHERQQFDAGVGGGTTANASNSLNTLHLDASVLTASRVAFTLGYFSTTGTTDSLQYTAMPIEGSATRSPNSRGFIGEVSLLPWQNTRFALQYVNYSKFNGGSTNYDGAGRNASDNNVLYLTGWFLF